LPQKLLSACVHTGGAAALRRRTSFAVSGSIGQLRSILRKRRVRVASRCARFNGAGLKRAPTFQRMAVCGLKARSFEETKASLLEDRSPFGHGELLSFTALRKQCKIFPNNGRASEGGYLGHVVGWRDLDEVHSDKAQSCKAP
jgi:hypothetical protein